MCVDLNNKLREVVDISETEWGKFQEEFRNEMEELKAKVEDILEEF
jgi:uncharacterized protein YeaO (DUF488 family)